MLNQACAGVEVAERESFENELRRARNQVRAVSNRLRELVLRMNGGGTKSDAPGLGAQEPLPPGIIGALATYPGQIEQLADQCEAEINKISEMLRL